MIFPHNNQKLLAYRLWDQLAGCGKPIKVGIHLKRDSRIKIKHFFIQIKSNQGHCYSNQDQPRTLVGDLRERQIKFFARTMVDKSVRLAVKNIYNGHILIAKKCNRHYLLLVLFQFLPLLIS